MGLLDKLKGKGRGNEGAGSGVPTGFDEMQAEVDAKGDMPLLDAGSHADSILGPQTAGPATVSDTSIISEAAPARSWSTS